MNANNDEVICPNCVHQFRAIPVNAQTRIAELEAALADAIKRAEAAERDAELLWANCRVIYFASPSGSYPLEHSPLAWGVKDSREDIIAALRRDAAIAKEGEL